MTDYEDLKTMLLRGSFKKHLCFLFTSKTLVPPGPPTETLHHVPSPSSLKGWDPSGYPPPLVHQVSARVDTSLYP